MNSLDLVFAQRSRTARHDLILFRHNIIIEISETLLEVAICVVLVAGNADMTVFELGGFVEQNIDV